MRRRWMMLLAMLLVLPDCAFIGHRGATLPQKYLEAQVLVETTISSAGDVIGALRESGVEIPPQTRSYLRSALRALKATNQEASVWVQAYLHYQRETERLKATLEACETDQCKDETRATFKAAKEELWSTEKLLERGLESLGEMTHMVADLVAGIRDEVHDGHHG